MVNAQGQIVSAPEPRGPRYGLLVAAAGPLTLEGHALSDGVSYRPVSCGKARLYPVNCVNGVTPPVHVFDPAVGWVDALPFVASAGGICGSVGASFADVEAEVLRNLANGEQSVAEEGMATILAAHATPLTVPDRVDIRSVIGALEQWLYGDDGVSYGNAGMLHLPPRYATEAVSYGVVRQVGALWKTPMETVVVFGGGYPDDGSIYISGHATVWREETVNMPDTTQTFDRIANQRYVLAQRTYAVAYDCHAAVAQYIPAGES